MPIAKIQPQSTTPGFSRLLDLMPQGPSGMTQSRFGSYIADICEDYFDAGLPCSMDDSYESENSLHGFISGVFATGFLTEIQFMALITAQRELFSDFRKELAQ